MVLGGWAFSDERDYPVRQLSYVDFHLSANVWQLVTSGRRSGGGRREERPSVPGDPAALNPAPED